MSSVTTLWTGMDRERSASFVAELFDLYLSIVGPVNAQKSLLEFSDPYVTFRSVGWVIGVPIKYTLQSLVDYRTHYCCSEVWYYFRKDFKVDGRDALYQGCRVAIANRKKMNDEVVRYLSCGEVYSHKIYASFKDLLNQINCALTLGWKNILPIQLGNI